MKRRTSKEEHSALVKKFLKEYPKNNYSIGDTCRACDISRVTYYHWMNTEPTFKEAIDAFREDFVDIAEQALLSLNKDLNPQAVIFTLKTLGKKRGYQEQSKIDVNLNGEIVNKISIEIVKPNNQIEDGTESTSK